MSAQADGLLADALSFVAQYHQSESLLKDNRGWNLRIALIATDSQEAVWLRVNDGRAVEIKSLCAPNDVSSEAGSDIVVRAECEVLRDILRLHRLPNEPYLFGELTVQGPEPDFLRLDYILTSLAGAA